MKDIKVLEIKNCKDCPFHCNDSSSYGYCSEIEDYVKEYTTVGVTNIPIICPLVDSGILVKIK